MSCAQSNTWENTLMMMAMLVMMAMVILVLMVTYNVVFISIRINILINLILIGQRHTLSDQQSNNAISVKPLSESFIIVAFGFKQ